MLRIRGYEVQDEQEVKYRLWEAKVAIHKGLIEIFSYITLGITWY